MSSGRCSTTRQTSNTHSLGNFTSRTQVLKCASRLRRAGGAERLDLLEFTSAGRFAIELKYPRAGFRALLESEPAPYVRGSQDAEDDTRYLIARDLRRIERLIEEDKADVGCVLLLTNIRSMWRVPNRPVTALDSAFRIHEGMTLTGTLEWGAGGREKDPVPPTGRYTCTWRDYSELPDATGASIFRYALLMTSSSPEAREHAEDARVGVAEGALPQPPQPSG